MYYRCANCNRAFDGQPEQCDNCGHRKTLRAERAWIITREEVYRSGGGANLFTLNKDQKFFAPWNINFKEKFINTPPQA